MEIKLNIYKKERNEKGERIIDKTYTTNTLDILYRPIEDIVSVIDLNNIKDDMELAKTVVVALKQVKPILMDVFYGLTEEEIGRTTTNEIVVVVVAIIMETLKGILSDETVKNVMGGQWM